MTSVDLPPPETPVMQVKRPSGIVAVTFFRLLPRAPTMRELAPGCGFAPPGGRRNDARAGEILAGERVRVGHDLGRRSLGDDFAAVDAGAGADVDDIIGGEDRVFVMLDDDARVLPRSRRRRSVSSRRALSRWCRPIEGSSST